jgi:hypothetical protein
MNLPILTNEWFEQNPPIVLIARMQFIEHHKNGKAFAYRARLGGTASFEVLIDGNRLICSATAEDDSEYFESGKGYRMRVSLPTGRAYGFDLHPGKEVALTVGGREVIGTGHIVNLVSELT